MKWLRGLFNMLFSAEYNIMKCSLYIFVITIMTSNVCSYDLSAETMKISQYILKNFKFDNVTTLAL